MKLSNGSLTFATVVGQRSASALARVLGGPPANTPCRALVLCRYDAPGTETSVGIARCAASDAFDELVGKKLALERAINRLPREERRAIWAEALPKLQAQR